jgi:CRISPR-associated protein Csb2
MLKLTQLQAGALNFLNRVPRDVPFQVHCNGAAFPRTYVVFKLLDENDDAFRYPHAKLVHIAGMVRHLAIQAMTRNPPRSLLRDKDHADWVKRVVRGKRDESSSGDHKQYSYIPLPSIGHAHSDGLVRNVMVAAPVGMENELSYLAEQLDGQVLEPEHDGALCEAEFSPLLRRRVELRKFEPPRGKFIQTHYLNEPAFGRSPSKTWQSVTPVILPGHNDKKAGKTIKLIQAALQQAGIETPCDFTWQAIPFFKNCLSAHKYDRSGRHVGYHRPTHLKDLTAVHVQLDFHFPVQGPLAIGPGRHCGFGLMAAVDN